MSKVLDVSADGFEQVVLKSRMPVLVDFWAPWCGPCKALNPILEGLADDYSGRASIVKVNADEEPELCERYRVRGLPTLLIFNNDDIKNVSQTKSKTQLAKLIDGHLDGRERDDIFEKNLSDSDMRSAFLATGDLERVRERLKDSPSLALQPFDDGTTPITLAIFSGESDRIEAIMDHNPELSLGNLAAMGDIGQLTLRVQHDASGLNEFEGAVGTPLTQAIHCKKWESAHVLLKAGAEIGTCEDHYFSPVNSALRSEVHALDILLANGLDLNASSNKEILHLAVCTSHDIEIIKRLLEKGLSPSATNAQGHTPIDLAKMILGNKGEAGGGRYLQNVIDTLIAACP